MGKVYYDMGFLSNAEVEECSATDMIGEYIGHTGPKVQKLLEKALGKVLLIDEAYRLAEGKFAIEAIDELVDCLTKPKYAKKLICILAGYDEDINRLMSVNPGLASRFPETISFRPLTAEECLKLLADLLQARKAPLDISALTSPSGSFRHNTIQKLKRLSTLKSWGNARDVETIGKNIFMHAISTAVPPITQLVITESMILDALDVMLSEQMDRNKAVGSHRNGHQPSGVPDEPLPPLQSEPSNSTNIQTQSSTNTNPDLPSPTGPATPTTSDSEAEDIVDKTKNSGSGSIRDVGVSDAIWHQLQKDNEAAKAREREYQRLESERIQRQELTEQEELRAMQEYERAKKAEQDARDDEERRRLEAERIQRELEMRRYEEMLAKMEEERQKREKERQKEIEAQKKLRNLGVCVAGYRWIKQVGGYRCAGGAHFVTDAQLGM